MKRISPFLLFEAFHVVSNAHNLPIMISNVFHIGLYILETALPTIIELLSLSPILIISHVYLGRLQLVEVI